MRSLTTTVNDLTTAVAQLNGLIAGVITPVTFTGSLSYLNASVTPLLAHEQHLHDLQYGGGEVEYALRQMLINAAKAQITTDLMPVQAALPSLQMELESAQADLQATRSQLAAAEASLAAIQRSVNANVVLTMPLLQVDSGGLTVAGGSLGFVSSGDAPVLFDSALGRLALYLRGPKDEFLVAYYDTFTGRPVFTLPAASGVLAFVGRSADAMYDDLTITLDSEAGGATCTLTVSLPGGPVPVTETWHGLPVDSEQLAAIVNGTPPEPVFVGSLAAAVDGKPDQLTLTAGLPLPLAAGALVSADGTVLTVARTWRATPRACRSIRSW